MFGYSVVELCTALIVSSAPALSGLYTGILANGEIYSRLRTKISMSLRRNQSDASGVEHTPDNGSGHSGWAHYEQLDDNAQFAKLGGQGEIVTSDIPMKSLPPSSRQHD
jgi:hypothetical protein